MQGPKGYTGQPGRPGPCREEARGKGSTIGPPGEHGMKGQKARDLKNRNVSIILPE